MSGRFFGQSIKRVEDLPLVKGKGRFVDDIELPGMLEAAFVRSPHPTRISWRSTRRGRGGCRASSISLPSIGSGRIWLWTACRSS